VKGLRELLQAFQEEFDPEEPVQLTLKLPYLPDRHRRKPWELEDLEAFLPQQGTGPSCRRIHVVCRSEPPDRMPILLAQCDAYIQPSYGEGFGLAILEAKAVGKPTIVTGWGGHMDFCTADNSYLVDYEMIPAGETQYDNGSRSALCARPLVASLRKQMRRVFRNPEEARTKASRSLEEIRCLTWESAAKQLIEALEERT